MFVFMLVIVIVKKYNQAYNKNLHSKYNIPLQTSSFALAIVENSITDGNSSFQIFKNYICRKKYIFGNYINKIQMNIAHAILRQFCLGLTFW